ncbi:hypothetical protein AZI86_01175 [Bdellovibrio bacteriovorus]|uniref:Uncharacterized protein n=1 Tax=Bdellovibrio bacteriovorus TaxID=959 RepID=A0A150WN33_BDEBC|nr:hypothetical protein [Bdellovibrio bacteriovorus]KYG65717.1 hypothetical protein AZI86_01175 [Bdellovibrio bacteriovorus]
MKLIWILLFILPLQVFAEGPPSGRFEFIAFKDSLVAFELREMKYIGDEGKVTLYQLDAKTWNLSVIDQKTYDKNFGSAKKHMAISMDHVFGSPEKTITLTSGDVLKIKYENCKTIEWSTTCKKQILTFNKETFTLTPPCKQDECNILVAAKWGQQLWLGQAVLGELQWYGKGFRVEDLNTKKSVFNSDKIMKDRTLIHILALNPKEDQMWAFSDQGIYVFDKSFKEIHHCPLVTPMDASGSFKFRCGDKN